MSVYLSASDLAALQARRLVARDYLRIVARDRGTGLPQEACFHSDLGNFSAEVIDPDTGNPTTYDWYGSGNLVSISDIPRVNNLSVQTVTITMSQVSDLVDQVFRLYDCKQARVEIYRGLFSLDSRLPVAPAFCRFYGFVDEIEVTTPAEGEVGGVVLKVVSHTQEMTRSNPDTRSHESQKLRSATDTFYQDTAVCVDWEDFWGGVSGKVDASTTTSPSVQSTNTSTYSGGGARR